MLLVLAAVVPLAALLAALAVRDARDARLQAHEQLRLTASLVAANQERIVESAEHLLGAISAVPQVRSLDPRACGEYFERLRGRYPVYANIGLMDVRGNVLCHAVGKPGSFNSADRDYFQQVLAQRRFSVGSAVVGRASGVPLVPVGLPVMEGDRLLAVAFAGIDLRRADDLLATTKLPEGVRLVVVDREATVLMEGPPRPDRSPGRRLNNQTVRAAVEAMQPGLGEADDSSGVRRLYAYAPTRPAQGAGYLVIASIDADRVTADAFDELRRQLAAVGISLLAGLALAAWLGGRFIVRPARHIVDAARQLEQGQLEARVPMERATGTQRGELALIASAFNLMADSLQTRQRELEVELGRSQDAYGLLDRVLNGMEEGLIACDMQGRFILYNEAAAKVFDMRGPPVPPSEWPTHFGLYQPDGSTLFKTSELPLAQAVRGRSGQLQMLVRRRQPSQERLLQCSYRPLGDAGEARGGLVVFSDVTELQRLQAEQVRQFERLRDAQRRLLEAQRIGRIGHWECDLDTGALSWSDKVQEVLDATPEAFDGSLGALLQRIHPEDRPALRALIDRPPATGRMDLQLRILRPGRTPMWVHAIGEVVSAANGRSRLAGVVQDITARKRGEAALLRSDSELRAYTDMLQRSAAAARAVSRQPTVERTVEEVERQARSVIGCPGARLTLADADPLPTPTAAAGRLWLRLASRDGTVTGVLELWHAEGGAFSDRDRHVAAELAQFAAIAIDNTRLINQIQELNTGLEQRIAERTAELTHQEARYRALAEQAPEIVWNVDSEGRVTYLNRAWHELVGGEPGDWLGYRWLKRIHPEDIPSIAAGWERSSATLEPFTGTRRLRARDGSWHTMSYRAAPVLGTQGEVLFWVGIDSDITALKAIESALRTTNQELEAFSYSVSHDLRAPLGAIGGFSRAVAQKLGVDGEAKVDPKVQHYLARIQAGADKMEQLIEALLSLARLVREPMQWGPVDLGALARESLENLHMREPGRQVCTRVADPLVAYGDTRLLRVVLQNLLGNAWKFSAQQPEARIEVGQLDDAPTFFVRDNGVGFDMAHAGKLFSPFQRLHTEAEFPGTGIGLATVRRVVARHHGRVWAEARPGEGTTFFFTLPPSQPAWPVPGGD